MYGKINLSPLHFCTIKGGYRFRRECEKQFVDSNKHREIAPKEKRSEIICNLVHTLIDYLTVSSHGKLAG